MIQGLIKKWALQLHPTTPMTKVFKLKLGLKKRCKKEKEGQCFRSNYSPLQKGWRLLIQDKQNNS